MTQTSPTERAEAYTEAALRWRALCADPQQWTAHSGQRALAAAFLRYHAAKLALEEATGSPLPA